MRWMASTCISVLLCHAVAQEGRPPEIVDFVVLAHVSELSKAEGLVELVNTGAGKESVYSYAEKNGFLIFDESGHKFFAISYETVFDHVFWRASILRKLLSCTELSKCSQDVLLWLIAERQATEESLGSEVAELWLPQEWLSGCAISQVSLGAFVEVTLSDFQRGKARTYTTHTIRPSSKELTELRRRQPKSDAIEPLFRKEIYFSNARNGKRGFITLFNKSVLQDEEPDLAMEALSKLLEIRSLIESYLTDISERFASLGNAHGITNFEGSYDRLSQSMQRLVRDVVADFAAEIGEKADEAFIQRLEVSVKIIPMVRVSLRCSGESLDIGIKVRNSPPPPTIVVLERTGTAE